MTRLARLLRALAAMVMAALGGCAHSPFRAPLTCPARGGPPWVELESPHFRMRTDLGVKEARRVLAEFEVVYGLVEDLSDFAFPPRRPPVGRIDLAIFERPKDYREIGMPNTDGMYLLRVHEVEPIPTIVVTGDLSSRTRRILQHELVHRFIRHHAPRAPLWIHEGLAEYLSTAKLEGKLAILGEPIPDWRVASFVGIGAGGVEGAPILIAADFPSVRELMTATARPSDSKKNSLFYAGAWELVHLLNGSKDYHGRFQAFLTLMAKGKAPEAAWQEVFGGIRLDRLEVEYRRYLVRQENLVWQTQYSPRPVPAIADRPLGDADVHLLWADLRIWDQTNAAKVEADFAEAKARAPRSPEIAFLWSRFLVAERKLKEALPPLRQAAAEGDNPRYLAALADLLMADLGRGAAASTELEQVIARLERAARSPNELERVAEYHLLKGEIDSGFPFAMRAVEADPACWVCVDVLAGFFYRKGQLGDAAELERHALNVLPEASEKARRHLEQHLERIEKAMRDGFERSPAPPAN